MIKKLIIIIIFIACYFVSPVSGKDNLSKGEAATLISAADFVKKKISNLLSWSVGYDIAKINRIKLVPSIKYIIALPRRVPPDGHTVLDLYAKVDDPEGLTNINGVRADLSEIGKLQNVLLVDSGLWGDKVSNDGVYSLQSNVSPSILPGNKEISVAVVNKQGWLTLSKTTIVVDTHPRINIISIVPQKTHPNSFVLATIKVENIPNFNDIKEVFADLREIGQEEKIILGRRESDIYSMKIFIPKGTPIGTKKITFHAINKKDETGKSEVTIEVIP